MIGGLLALSDAAAAGWMAPPVTRGASCYRSALPPVSVAVLMQLDDQATKQPFWAQGLEKREERKSSNRPAGTLILIRHGETETQRGTAFIGWSDPDLSAEGRRQTTEAARAILETGYTVDVVHTSLLKRSLRTTWLLLQQLNKIYLPVYKHWRLNERCYGALTGEPIEVLHRRYGAETIASWRRSSFARPPPFDPTSPHNPAHDPRYERWQDRRGQSRPVALPNGESMGEAILRTLPVWKREILPDLRRGKNVLVVAHGNTIRALVQAIDDVSD